MAANVVTPNASVAAPAAAAAPATPAPASTPPAGGGAPAGGATPGGSGGAAPVTSPHQHIKDILTERLKNPQGVDGATAEQIAEITAPAKPFQEFEQPDQELPLTGEEADAAAQTEESEQQADPDKPAEQTAHPDEDLFNDDPYREAATVEPKDLAAALDAKPELKALIDADPEFKSKLFANARRSSKLAEMEKYVRSPEEAKVLQETTGTFNNLSDLMGSVNPGDPSTLGNFLTALVDQTILRGEDGQPLMDSKGNPRTDGSVFRMLSSAYALRHTNLRRQYEAEGNDEAVAAIDLLNGLQGIGATPASRESEQAEMTPQQIERAKSLDAREKALSDQQKAAREETSKSFKRSVALGRAEKFDGQIDELLSKATGLGDFNRDAVASSIKDSLKTFLKTDHAYQREVKALEAKPQTETTRNALVEVAVRYMRNNLRRLAAPILAEAGGQVMTQQATQSADHAARASASRGDGGAKGPSGPTAPAKLEGKALNEHVIRELVAKTGQQPSNAEIIAAAARYRLAAARR